MTGMTPENYKAESAEPDDVDIGFVFRPKA